VQPLDAGDPRLSAVSQVGLRQVERYLLPSERAVITTRRHWAMVAEPVGSAVLALLVAGWAVVRIGDDAAFLVNAITLAAIVVLARMLWKVYEYRRDWFVVTDERLLLTYGIVTRRVAIMPLTKVTDMSYNVSVLGRLLGYGEFVFESAGQDQALHAVNFLGRSQFLFGVLSEELFGPRGIVSSRRFRPRYDD
jgi:membrane protein YdbS with pleckstrin-like domain